jgi:hypothetical protein
VTLALLPTPAKVLVTGIIMTLALGMLGALGQIIIHDIIPTFFSSTVSNTASLHTDMEKTMPPTSTGERGDLFAEPSPEKQEASKPFYKGEQFIWTLKWTHIHLFGINMIFIFMGIVTLLLDAGTRFRTWLIALPFIGVLIDILAMWLKGFVSPLFFWLHIPGGGIFAGIFAYVSLRALWEMWVKSADSIN